MPFADAAQQPLFYVVGNALFATFGTAMLACWPWPRSSFPALIVWALTTWCVSRFAIDVWGLL